jgi:hypothetical protein
MGFPGIGAFFYDQERARLPDKQHHERKLCFQVSTSHIRRSFNGTHSEHQPRSSLRASAASLIIASINSLAQHCEHQQPCSALRASAASLSATLSNTSISLANDNHGILLDLTRLMLFARLGPCMLFPRLNWAHAIRSTRLDSAHAIRSTRLDSANAIRSTRLDSAHAIRLTRPGSCYSLDSTRLMLFARLDSLGSCYSLDSTRLISFARLDST